MTSARRHGLFIFYGEYSLHSVRFLGVEDDYRREYIASRHLSAFSFIGICYMIR